MIELINYCLGGDGPGRKWTEKCSKKKKRRIRKEELEVHTEELRKLEVQQEKPNADKGEGDCIKFDLRDEDTFDVKECPVGPYLEGLSFETYTTFSQQRNFKRTCLYAKNQMGNQTQCVFKCFTKQLCVKIYVSHVMLKYVPMNMF